MGGGGQGGGRLGGKGAGGVREAGEEGAGSRIPNVAGSGRKREKLHNIAQYFAIEKIQGAGAKNTGWEPGLQGTGSGRFKPSCPLDSCGIILQNCKKILKYRITARKVDEIPTLRSHLSYADIENSNMLQTLNQMDNFSLQL